VHPTPPLAQRQAMIGYSFLQSFTVSLIAADKHDRISCKCLDLGSAMQGR
jgi:hypothetical protein